MKDILICTHDPMLVKNLYGILRDQGCDVETADHCALAVQMALAREYDAVIIDSESFGLPVEDAATIIKTISPDTGIMIVGPAENDTDVVTLTIPVDLEEFKQTIIRMTRPKTLSKSF
jgi:DNA-binding response OmpR family regulator